jgi:hypothetical protein
MTATSCVAGREAVVRFKNRQTGKVNVEHVVSPANWSKSRFATYCRNQHPEATVVVEDWPSAYDGWQVRVWIAGSDD